MLNEVFDFFGGTKKQASEIKLELEDLRNKGVLSQEEYNKKVIDLEDCVDIDTSATERYKKAYKNQNVEKCICEIMDIYAEHKENFRKAFVLSGCFKDPLGYSYSEDDYNLTRKILIRVYKCFSHNEDDKCMSYDLRQLIILTEVFHKSNDFNVKKLQENQFSKYSLSEQIRMMCIFLQDQQRLMRKMAEAKFSKNDFTTGTELMVSDMTCQYNKNQKASIVDNYEVLLEDFDILIKYLYATRKNELKENFNFDHGDINCYYIASFQEITYIALQRVIMSSLEEKFRYSNWNIEINQNKNNELFYIFKAQDFNKFRAHIIASSRRQYRMVTTTFSTLPEPEGMSMKAIDQLAKTINISNLHFDNLDENLYRSARLCADVRIKVYKKTTKSFYLTCNLNGMNVEDIINTFEYLYTISKIYMSAVLNFFNGENNAHYKYLVPIMQIDDIIIPLMKLYNFDRTYAKNLLRCFILDEKVRSDGDIFTRPLINIGKEHVLFCETLITQINLERLFEMLFTKYNTNLAPMGKEFEKKLISNLSGVTNVKVNTKQVEFMAYDGKNVEFDFIGTLDDYLLLFEFKSVITPYGDKQLYKAEQTIKEGVAQVLRRCNIMKKDWCKIKEQCNIELPDEPFADDKIIRLVCSNIFDFTTLKYDGVQITDESTLLKYFCNPYVDIRSTNKNGQVLKSKKIWKNSQPNLYPLC